MLKLEDLKPGLPLDGLEPAIVATVAAVVPIGEDAVQVFYRSPDGSMKERLLGRADEESLSVATVERPWSFDGDGAAFQLTCEAKRIDLAFLFGPMMAVHTSNVEPLPHQITAVYESMLPRQPLRFVLADDPGAGKTIMADLYIRELIMRADARRVLIVAPGSLVEQWRDELFEKFGLEFRVYSSGLEEASPSGNPFEDHHQLIVRLELERVCIDNELIITTWSPIHLRTKLKELYWKADKAAVGAMAFWEDTLRYLYLPRLKNRESLSQAIRTGAASKEFFGIAYGQNGDTYEGFHLGDGSPQLDDTLLLIEPHAAQEYETAHLPVVGRGPGGGTEPIPGGGIGPGGGPGPVGFKAKTWE